MALFVAPLKSGEGGGGEARFVAQVAPKEGHKHMDTQARKWQKGERTQTHRNHSQRPPLTRCLGLCPRGQRR
jgi:hypothetical protein